MPNKIPYKNVDGYADPTAHAALNAVQREMDESDIRVQAFIKAVKTLMDLSGYDLLARIEILDRRTGRTYR